MYVFDEKLNDGLLALPDIDKAMQDNILLKAIITGEADFGLEDLARYVEENELNSYEGFRIFGSRLDEYERCLGVRDAKRLMDGFVAVRKRRRLL